MKRYPALVAIVLMLSARQALGAWQHFVPKFVGYQGELTSEGRYLKHTITEAAKDAEETNINEFKETLEISSIGYVYNPNMVIFEISLSGLLDREKYRHKRGDSDTETVTSGQGHEYELKGLVLRTKPYNLDFDLTEQRPFGTGGYSDNNSTGRILQDIINLNYRKESIGGRLGYVYYNSQRSDNSGQENAVESEAASHTVSLNSSYKGADYSLNLSLARSLQKNTTESSASGTTGSVVTGNNASVRDRLSTTASTVYRNFTILSSAQYTATRTEQDTVNGDSMPSDRSASKGIQEKIDIDLPWNMDSKIKLSANKRDSSRRNLDQGAVDWISNYNEDNEISGVLHHKLFDSLRSKLSADLQNNNTDTSSRLTQNYLFSSDYVKLLRGGQMTANISDGLIISKEDGKSSYTDVVAQDVTILPISESITRSHAVVDSVNVEACELGADNTIINGQRYSCDCYEKNTCALDIDRQLWQQLNEGLQWTIQDVKADFLTVKIISLPATETYDIRVNYSMPEAKFTTSSNTTSFSAKLSLLDNTLSSSVSCSLTREKFLEGDSGFDDLSPSVVQNYLDLMWEKDSFTLKGSYSSLAGEKFEEKRWLAMGRYNAGHMINRYVKASWGGDYKREDVHGQDATQLIRHDIKRLLNANVGFFGTIPFTSMRYTAQALYRRKRGYAPHYKFNDNGLWQNIIYQEDDTNTYSRSLSINGIVPRVGFDFSLQGAHILTENLANSIDTKTNSYLITTKRNWIFGGTTLSLEGHYSILDQWGEIGADNVESHKQESETEVLFKVVRVLF